nr:unnamed protein product [Digitaria exilis]
MQSAEWRAGRRRRRLPLTLWLGEGEEVDELGWPQVLGFSHGVVIDVAAGNGVVRHMSSLFLFPSLSPRLRLILLGSKATRGGERSMGQVPGGGLVAGGNIFAAAVHRSAMDQRPGRPGRG